MQRQHYLFTDVRWVASSNVPSRYAVLVSYSLLYGHFTCASEDVRLDSKERAHCTVQWSGK